MAVAIVAAENHVQDRVVSTSFTSSVLPCPKLSLGPCPNDDPWFYLFTIDGGFEQDERQASVNHNGFSDNLKRDHHFEDMVEAVLMDAKCRRITLRPSCGCLGRLAQLSAKHGVLEVTCFSVPDG